MTGQKKTLGAQQRKSSEQNTHWKQLQKAGRSIEQDLHQLFINALTIEYSPLDN